MPLITKPTALAKKEQIRVRLAQAVLSEIQAYCQWQAIDKDYFIEQAALEIFKKDKDWKAHKDKQRQKPD